MSRKSSNINDHKLIRLSSILSLLFVFIFMSVSVGYAVFTQVINLQGNISMGTQGDFKISNVVKYSSSNTDQAVPTWTDDSVDFNLTFIKSNEQNPVYNATYNITLTNDTFYERLISNFNFSFTVNGQDEQPLGILDVEVQNYQDGEVMQPLTEKIVTVVFSFTPTVDADSYEVDGEGSFESNEKPFGEIIANSMTPSTGNIKDGALQQVTVNLSSTYESNKEINIWLKCKKYDTIYVK